MVTSRSFGHAYNQPNLSVCAYWNKNATTFTGGNSGNQQYSAIFINKDSTIYAADHKNGQVLIWHNGSLQPTSNISSDFVNPSSLFVDINGDVYVDNGHQNKQVNKWVSNSAPGELVLSVNGSCTGLFIDNNRMLYCSIAEYHVVIKVALIDQNKTRIDVAGTGCPGPLPNTLDHPHGIFVDNNFNLYVADTYNNRIQRFVLGELKGQTVAGFGSPMRFLLNRPTSVILDGNNYLFIADSRNHRIVRLIQEEFECIIGCTEMPGDTSYQLNYPRALAFDSSGNLFVTDWQNHRIQIFDLLCDSYVVPNIPANATWSQNGVTVAGGHGNGSDTNQLDRPHGIFVGNNETIVIADNGNHRIVQWKKGDTNGEVVAGGKGIGSRLDQLAGPMDVLIDKETDSLIISEYDNQRVVRWSRRNGTTQGEVLVDNIASFGLAMDDYRNLYVADEKKNEVRRYQLFDNMGTLVAGGNGYGTGLNQLNRTTYIFVDRQQTLYVSDYHNSRVLKWQKGATHGMVVAGGQGLGNALTQLSHTDGLLVDISGTLYVADNHNHRVLRWPQGAKQGTIIVGGNGRGSAANQLNEPIGLSFDCHGNLFVSEYGNHRVQRFAIE